MRPRLLLFTRTTDYRHDSIPAGVAMVEAIGAEDGFEVDAHEDPTAFEQANLKRYDLVARLDNHPKPQRATISVEDRDHPSTCHLEPTWQWDDEWYNFRANSRGRVRVLATVGEATYTGGEMGGDHPIAWCGRYGGGRSWYTALGHAIEAYHDPVFAEHVRGGINSLVREGSWP